MSSLFSFKFAQEIPPQRQLGRFWVSIFKEQPVLCFSCSQKPPNPKLHLFSVVLHGVGNTAFCILARWRNDLMQFLKNALPKFLLGWD